MTGMCTTPEFVGCVASPALTTSHVAALSTATAFVFVAARGIASGPIQGSGERRLLLR